LVSAKELRLGIENAKLRQLLAQAGIDAAEQKIMEACNAFCWKITPSNKECACHGYGHRIAEFKKCGQR
jgi:hypothetical protein